VANHDYEKSSFPFCFARSVNFNFLLCKGKLKVKKQFASGASKKSSRHPISKAFCSGSAETLSYGFLSTFSPLAGLTFSLRLCDTECAAGCSNVISEVRFA